MTAKRQSGSRRPPEEIAFVKEQLATRPTANDGLITRTVKEKFPGTTISSSIVRYYRLTLYPERGSNYVRTTPKQQEYIMDGLREGKTSEEIRGAFFHLYGRKMSRDILGLVRERYNAELERRKNGHICKYIPVDEFHICLCGKVQEEEEADGNST